MSFVVAEPELVQVAAQNLANLRDTLAEASASAAAPTTGVVAAAQDEVSAAVAELFGSFGQEYQVISAQAQAFHEQFVSLLNAGAGAYLSTEVANAEQTLLNAAQVPVQELQSFGSAAVSASSGALGALVPGLTPTVGLPLPGGGGVLGQILGGSTGVGIDLPTFLGGGTSITSLVGSLGGGSITQSLNGVVTGLESGALSLLPGQLGTGLPTTLQSLEALLLPGFVQTGASTGLATIEGPYQALYANTFQNLQAFDALWSANPAPFLHQFIANQMAYEQIVASSLQQAASDFATGAAALPAAFQAAYQALIAGDVTGALTDIGKGFSNLFLPGLSSIPMGP